MRQLILLAIQLTLLSSYTFTLETTQCVKVDQQQIASLFDHWNDSLKSGDAKKFRQTILSMRTITNHIKPDSFNRSGTY